MNSKMVKFDWFSIYSSFPKKSKMSIYSKYVLPNLIHYACGGSSFSKQREKIVPFAEGNTLEIGVGTGLNIPFYDGTKITKLTAIEPSEDTWKKCEVDLKKLPFEFEFILASAEELPFENETFDTIVMTYALCTIPNAEKALLEMKRVLKPTGSMFFSEHGIAPEERVRFIQNKLNPIWKKISGGCNLNRNIPELIENNGFEMVDLEEMHIPGWKPGSYNYWGSAKKKST